MPQGIVRSGDFRKGTPVILPHQYGNPVAGKNEPFGSPQPQSNPALSKNQVTWGPTPSHFGNQVSFSLQSVPPIVIVAPGGVGTTSINLTNRLGVNSATLTYSGAPVGVTLAFAPNPDTGIAVVTITVGASVPAGRYTITVLGTAVTPNIEDVKIQLVVS